VRDVELAGLEHLHHLRRDGFRIRKPGLRTVLVSKFSTICDREVATQRGAALRPTQRT
jgi:hypothetical protein